MWEHILLILFTLVEGSFAAYCYDSEYSVFKSYCSGYCCGFHDTCCSYSTKYTGYTYVWGWSVGHIVGAAVGGIVGLIILIAVIVIIIKACNKSGSRGRIVNPQPTGGVFITSTTGYVQQPPPYNAAPPPGYSAGPSPYPQPGGKRPPGPGPYQGNPAYPPPPPPNYASPGGPSTSSGPPPAYQPPNGVPPPSHPPPNGVPPPTAQAPAQSSPLAPVS